MRSQGECHDFIRVALRDDGVNADCADWCARHRCGSRPSAVSACLSAPSSCRERGLAALRAQPVRRALSTDRAWLGTAAYGYETCCSSPVYKAVTCAADQHLSCATGQALARASPPAPASRRRHRGLGPVDADWVLRAVAIGQVKGQVRRRITASVDATIASLPPELAAEWGTSGVLSSQGRLDA